MAWVKFKSDYDFRPTKAVTIAYKAGMVMNVTTPCAVQAIAAGKAERTESPRAPAKYGPPLLSEATDAEHG